MNGITGNDQFNGRFDFFEWSAPYYTTPEEVVRALDAVPYQGKTIQGIYAIGAVRGYGWDEAKLFKHLKDAGVEIEENQVLNYPRIDAVRLPWKVEVCEPIQFVFSDKSTMDILPLVGGGARIGFNTIPIGMTDGLNRSELDSSRFFSPTFGTYISRIEYDCDENIRRNYWYYEGKCHGEPRKRKEYTFNFSLCVPQQSGEYHLTLKQQSECWYQISLVDTQDYPFCDTAPFGQVKTFFHKVNQVKIINGGDHGGVFWITAHAKDEEKQKALHYFDNYRMSVWDFLLMQYLGEFLYRYFDPTVQEQDELEPEKQQKFDWYGCNRYTFEAMEQMLQDIRDVAEWLIRDPDDPALYDIIDEFSYGKYTDKKKDELTEAEKHALRKLDIPVAVDFYQRFVQRMEHMMKLPGAEIVTFAGP